MAASMASMVSKLFPNSLSERGKFLLDFDVSGAKSWKKRIADTGREELIDLSCAESHISAGLIDDWMNDHQPLKEWQSEDQFYYTFHGNDYPRLLMAEFINTYFKPDPISLIEKENVVLANGAETVMECLAFSLADPGDYFMITTPYYYNIDQNFGLRAGVKILPVHTSPSDVEPFKLNIVDIKEAYDSAVLDGKCVRGFIFVNPSNPLGTVYTAEEVKSVINFCAENNLHLLADEVYSQMVYQESEKFRSVLSFTLPEPQLVHVIYGLSKDLALSGLRVGALVSRNQSLLDTFRTGRQSLYSSVPLLIARLAANILSDDRWLKNVYYPTVHSMMRDNREVVTACMDEIRVPYINGSAGFFIWANFSHYIQPCTFENERIFVRRLVDEAKVCLMPGEMFHCVEPGWFRVLITHTADNTALAMERLKRFVSSPTVFDKYKTVQSSKKLSLPAGSCTDGLEDMLLTLSKQIKSSDWLIENTAEKWQTENPELAEEFEKRRNDASVQDDENSD